MLLPSLEAFFSNIFAGDDGVPFISPPSKFLYYLSGSMIRNQELDIWGKLNELFGSAGEGIFFEKMAHGEVIKNLQNESLNAQQIYVGKGGKTYTKTEFVTFSCNIARKSFIRSW